MPEERILLLTALLFIKAKDWDIALIFAMRSQARVNAPACIYAGTVGVGLHNSYGRRQREVQANRLCYVVKLDAKRTHRKTLFYFLRKGEVMSQGSTERFKNSNTSTGFLILKTVRHVRAM